MTGMTILCTIHQSNLWKEVGGVKWIFAQARVLITDHLNTTGKLPESLEELPWGTEMGDGATFRQVQQIEFLVSESEVVLRWKKRPQVTMRIPIRKSPGRTDGREREK